MQGHSWKTIVYYLAISMITFSCEKSPLSRDYPESIALIVANGSELNRKDESVMIDMEMLNKEAPDFNPRAFLVLHGEQELPSHAVDSDNDGAFEQIIFVSDFAPQQERRLTIRYAKSGERTRDYPKRTQAELSHKFGGRFEDRKYIDGQFRNVEFVRVPPEHTDHSFFFRYEGPGWESDKVGYRFYLDWRNATDIFGKKTHDMVLQNVGQDGFDSYHEMSDWGMDILKVGESMGIGAIGMWHNGQVYRVSETDSTTCGIVANGPVYSQIHTRYFGWRVGSNAFDLTSDLSISAGSRLTRHDLTISGNPENLCTGLVKHEAARILKAEAANGEWSYFANYGKQSLADDNLGMAILYRKSDLIEFVEDDFSHVIVLRPGDGGKLSYYFLAAWEQEPGGIKTEAEFQTYLEETVQRLNHPVRVTL